MFNIYLNLISQKLVKHIFVEDMHLILQKLANDVSRKFVKTIKITTKRITAPDLQEVC